MSMKITPIEIERHQFQKVFRGCDADEVKAFLSQVARQIEDLVRDNQALTDAKTRMSELTWEIRTASGEYQNRSQLRP